MTNSTANLKAIATRIRALILQATTLAGSGHPSSSLSATDLMTVLMFGDFFRFRLDDPANPNNDRLIFSKGHASPLFYALWVIAGGLTEHALVNSLRKFDSALEGHPSMRFPFTEAATGSLGQGLSIGVGMALNAKLDHQSYRTYVLLGDSEMAEGSVWEAMMIAHHYHLDNLVGMIDVNRLGQRGETMFGHDVRSYQKKVSAFGWNAIVVDGHRLPAITQAFKQAHQHRGQPTMIIAKTIKGKGVRMLENQNGWHGKPLSEDELQTAFAELAPIDRLIRGRVARPTKASIAKPPPTSPPPAPIYPTSVPVSTRKAYGNALSRIGQAFPEVVVLDAEVSNSTYAETFQKKYPQRFFEMYIAEQNMLGTALGFARRGKKPFVSTFAAFLTRAHDQIRMAQYSDPNLVVCGSHAGVSIGADGPSQMGLEDLAMMRAIHGSVVCYPSDAISCERLVEALAAHRGLAYIRTTRGGTPILYSAKTKFRIGGSQVLKQSKKDRATIIAAGITVHEALVAYEKLAQKKIFVRVIDCYSIKPLDVKTIANAVKETAGLIVAEDHFPEGGLGEAVASAFPETPLIHLAVRRMPRSGEPEELLRFEQLDANAMARAMLTYL